MAKKGWSGMMQRRGMVAADNTGGTSDLAFRINNSSMGNITFSGRGHGRKTPHGRGPKTRGPRTMKRDMLYFVRDYVRELRANNPLLEENWVHQTGWVDGRDIANYMVNDVQYFDCSEIWEYVWSALPEMYPDFEVPPSPDAIMPAKAVGLYINKWGNQLDEPIDNQNMYLCIPTPDAEQSEEFQGRHYIVATLDHPYEEKPDGKAPYPTPMPIGEVSVVEGYEMFDIYNFPEWKENRGATEEWLDEAARVFSQHIRIVAALLATINQPRFVVQGKRDVSLVKRQSFKKAAGRFIPDSWNMITWNVDKPVKAKDHEENNGARLPLHFRRGHWRVGEKGWKNTRWSETRNRWEQYIHGYEAGHPAFGVKKSYHLPRKEEV